MIVENGTYTLALGGSSSNLPCSTEFSVTGEWVASLYNVYAVADKNCLNKGDKAFVKVTATLEDTSRLCQLTNKPRFTISDATVASVNEEGEVTALNSGTAIVEVAVEYNGKTVMAQVPVAVR